MYLFCKDKLGIKRVIRYHNEVFGLSYFPPLSQKSVILHAYQSVQLGSVNHFRSILHSLVQIKVATGATRWSPKNKCFCRKWPQNVVLSLSFLTDCALVLFLACVLVTAGTTEAHLSCTGNAASPQGHIHMCCHIKVCCVSQHSLKSVEDIPGVMCIILTKLSELDTIKVAW